jgi:hypothetical protein
MINRIFIISESFFTSGELPPEDNLYYSLLIQSSESAVLERAYSFMSGAGLSDWTLTLGVHEPFTPEFLRAIASFLFLPGYLRIGALPVIHLKGDAEDLLREQERVLSAYLCGQGFRGQYVPIVLSGAVFRSPEEVAGHYGRQLQAVDDPDKDIYFHFTAGGDVQRVLLALQGVERQLHKENPGLFALLKNYRALGKELPALRARLAVLEAELVNQQLYVGVLQSGSQAKEIQDFYNREYETLPLWYKRLGHIVKVLSGKRTFRSLFRDDVKKYKD